ncbi:Histone deacetylase HDT2 [Acorus gramineus]|uniref:Histone deacetylase HDT2 n=1 Tax=Acorus gramineus TaxID=55184 RepID=A0AAV9BK71_ACOGR|nr:Histone deacetylase HDT2 [Acorus gramineus]
MEFWGVEVKSGESIKCEPGEQRFIHLSQACIGEPKKEKNDIQVFVKVDDKKLVLGTLSAEKYPQISYDLVFEKEFELSHSGKNNSELFSSSDEEQPVRKANGKAKLKDEVPKLVAAKDEAKVDAKLNSGKVSDDDSEDDDTSEDDELDNETESDRSDDEEGSDDEDASDADEVTPMKVESSKKRVAESATKTPVPEKKAKLVTPSKGEKTGADGKKSGHTATPHPSKQAAKTPATDKQKQTPKSAGSVACKSCSKTFNSDNALQAHSKAKHAAK